jgi:hypothetical protein
MGGTMGLNFAAWLNHQTSTKQQNHDPAWDEIQICQSINKSKFN